MVSKIKMSPFNAQVAKSMLNVCHSSRDIILLCVCTKVYGLGLEPEGINDTRPLLLLLDGFVLLQGPPPNQYTEADRESTA